MREHKRVSLIILLLLIASIGFPSCIYFRMKRAKDVLKLQDTTQRVMKPKSAFSDSVKIDYLGCGGFMIEYSGETIMIDPYFTNISVSKIVTSEYRSDTALINHFFLKKTGQVYDENGKIENILLSHAHHDHLADIPALLKNNLKNDLIQVYGSRTAINILRSFSNLVADTDKQYHDLEQAFHTINDNDPMLNKPQISSFEYSSKRKMRFAAIPSLHAGHFHFFKGQKLPFIGGHINQPLKNPPTRAMQYKEGQNFNYLIDLLDSGGRVVYRIFSNAGSASDKGVGFPPESVLKERNVDLLLICGANYDVAKDYPEALIDYLKPQSLFVAHWENFFKPIPHLQRRPEIVPNTNIKRLMKKLVNFSKKRGYPKSIFIEKPIEKPLILQIK